MGRLGSLEGCVLTKMPATRGCGSDSDLFECEIYNQFFGRSSRGLRAKGKEAHGEGDFWTLLKEYVDRFKPTSR
jgi:hypothetical protein